MLVEVEDERAALLWAKRGCPRTMPALMSFSLMPAL